jgi:hypothetical protein
VQKQLRRDVDAEARGLHDARHHKDSEQELGQIGGEAEPALERVSEKSARTEQC